MRIPKHIGIIPDGNRRWAKSNGMKKEEGYKNGINPGLSAFLLCRDMGVSEITFYGFTVDNTKRPKEQRLAFSEACINAVELLAKENSELLVVGNTNSAMFPKELIPYTKRTVFGKGGIKVNFLVNYSWEWDLKSNKNNDGTFFINSYDISRVDLIIRWGGMRRLSGFLPIQSVYSDFFVLENLWPDYDNSDILNAFEWYGKQDVTLGG